MSYIQKLIDAQNNIIIICDKEFNAKYINKSFYDYFRKDRLEEIISLLKNRNFDEEFKIKLKNYRNEKFTFLAKLTKIEDDISISLTNITKLTAYQKSLIQSNLNLVEFKKIVDKFLIVSKTDINGKITYVNDKFTKISGYSKEELLGTFHNIVRHPDMPSYVFKNMWKTILSGKIWQGVIKNRKKNGEAYFVKTMIAPLFNSKKKIKEFIALRIDITELITAKEKAHQAKKAKEIFLANMSHEIRTPLTGIIGFIDILKRRKLSDNIKEIISIIDNSAETLLTIVNDILDISKIESEGITIHKVKFNPKNSFKNTIELFRAKAEQKNIKYNYNIDISECIISDEHRLKQVLSNLIGNAIKFTPRNGEIDVNINSYKVENKLKIHFSIKDSGIGIPKEKQEKLFKPFSQIEGIEKQFGGTGLGLYISSQIVKKLGGELKVKSEENNGSEFYFSIEVEECEEIKNNKYMEIKVEGKILIVEDNLVNQELLKAILDTKGNILCEVANNGAEALEKYKNNKYDLIFMDIFMPIMQGEEATKKILEYEKNNNLQHTPIIALTANALEGDKEKFLSQGFDDYISKPIKIQELDRVLAKYLKVKEEVHSVSEIAKEMELDETIVKQLIELYFENIYKDIEELKDAINKNDFENTRIKSHKIAGSSGAVKFMDIYELAKEIEYNSKEKKNINYSELFNKIVHKLKKYKTEFKIDDLK